MKRLLTSILLSIGAIASSIAPAAAIPYGASTVYKAIDGTNTVVVFSATAGSRVQVNLGTQPKPSAKLAGACGEVRISSPSTGSFSGLKVDGVAVDAATLITQTLPSCTSGTFAEPRSANFKTPNNQVIIVGKTVGSAVSVELPQATTRSVTVNACGFGVLRPATGQTLPASFSVDATSYTLASLPNAGNAPLCRTANGISSGYVPSTWP